MDYYKLKRLLFIAWIGVNITTDASGDSCDTFYNCSGSDPIGQIELIQNESVLVNLIDKDFQSSQMKIQKYKLILGKQTIV